MTAIPSVGRLSRCHDHGVCQIVAELFSQPEEMAHVSVVGYLAELHLDREDLPSAFDDQIDLSVTAPCAQMRSPRLGGLGVDANTERYERLEERSKECPLTGYCGSGRLCPQQRGRVDTEQACRERRVREVVLRQRGETREPVTGR
jgi:hypothetical protein